jgi:hypothetical protein
MKFGNKTLPLEEIALDIPTMLLRSHADTSNVNILPQRILTLLKLKSITDFSDRFFQALMIEFPALLRNSQQKGERNGEYFNHRSRGLLNDSRGV